MAPIINNHDTIRPLISGELMTLLKTWRIKGYKGKKLVRPEEVYPAFDILM